jgi:hypothetical protein
VRPVKEECLPKIILLGERSFRRALSEYVAHYHAERNHQGKSNVLLFPRVTETRRGRITALVSYRFNFLALRARHAAHFLFPIELKKRNGRSARFS